MVSATMFYFFFLIRPHDDFTSLHTIIGYDMLQAYVG